MNKVLKIGLASLVLLITQSFTPVEDNSIFGVFGVTNNDTSGIELMINEDHTFTFKDYSNPNKNINTSGVWEIKNGIIELKSTDSPYKFHNKWRVTNNGSTAKSRNGLTFYTLCKIKPTQ